MNIYIHFIEYEVIHLVTTSKDDLLASVNEKGGLSNGDFVEVWKDNKRIAYYDKGNSLDALREQ